MNKRTSTLLEKEAARIERTINYMIRRPVVQRKRDCSARDIVYREPLRKRARRVNPSRTEEKKIPASVILNALKEVYNKLSPDKRRNILNAIENDLTIQNILRIQKRNKHVYFEVIE